MNSYFITVNFTPIIFSLLFNTCIKMVKVGHDLQTDGPLEKIPKPRYSSSIIYTLIKKNYFITNLKFVLCSCVYTPPAWVACEWITSMARSIDSRTDCCSLGLAYKVYEKPNLKEKQTKRNESTYTHSIRVVTKISSCQVNTTSRRGIKRLGISFGSIFLLFSNKSSRGPLS